MSYKILFNSATKTFFLIDFEKRATMELKTIKEDKKRFSCQFTRKFLNEIEEVKLGDSGIIGDPFPDHRKATEVERKECRSGDKGVAGKQGGMCDPGVPIQSKYDTKLFVFSCSSNNKLIYSKGGKSFRDIVCFMEEKYHYNPRFDAYFNDEDDLMCYWNDIVDGFETGYLAIQDGETLFEFRFTRVQN